MPSLISYEFFFTKNLFNSEEAELQAQNIRLPEIFSKYDISYLFLKNTFNSLLYLALWIIFGKLFAYFNTK